MDIVDTSMSARYVASRYQRSDTRKYAMDDVQRLCKISKNKFLVFSSDSLLLRCSTYLLRHHSTSNRKFQSSSVEYRVGAGVLQAALAGSHRVWNGTNNLQTNKRSVTKNGYLIGGRVAKYDASRILN